MQERAVPTDHRTATFWIYFHNLTELSWLAEATIPVTGDCARAEIMFSCPGIVMLLFSAMFHSSNDCSHIWKKQFQYIKKSGKNRNKMIWIHCYAWNVKDIVAKILMLEKKSSVSYTRETLAIKKFSSRVVSDIMLGGRTTGSFLNHLERPKN